MNDRPLVQTDDPRLARVRLLARALDSAVAIPGTNFRFGLDALLGIAPGLGDLAGAALSGYIVLTGIQLGAPRAVVMRMLGNVALDTIAGSVPVVGDLFDASWKSNNRNVALIEQHVGAPRETRTASTLMLVSVIAALVLLAGAGIALTIFAIRWLMSF